MAKDVLITPASGLIEFKDAGGNVDSSIQLNDSNVLVITGTISLGDLAADVYIGDGVNEVDIVYEQNGGIYGLAGKTLTLGLANSYLSIAANITSGANITGNVVSSGNVSGTYLLGNVYYATGFSASKIYNGTSEVAIGSSGGAANISIGGTSNVAVFSSTGMAITGDLSVSGNATLSGNILGDRLQNGTTSIDIQTAGGNANISVAGTSNVVVFSTAGQNVSGYITSSGNITSVGNISGSYVLGNGSQLTGILTGNSFGVISVSGQSDVVADQATDTLTLTAGSGIAITCDPTTDTIIISASGGSEIFVDGADFGTVTELVTLNDDLGLITESVEAESDLGSIVTSGVFFPDLLVVDDISKFNLGGGSNGQYIGTYGNGTIFWQSLASAPLTGNMVGNINGNSYSITNLATLSSSVLTTGVVTGNLIPSANITYNLGNTTNRWRDLWISNSTIYLGEATITATGNSLSVSGQSVVTQTANGNTTTTNLIATTVSATGNITAGNLSTGGSLSVTGTSDFTGNITAGHINPGSNGAVDLGSTTSRWRNIYTSDLHLNNGIGNWTVVEGEEDLFLHNNNNGKVFKFALVEVDPSQSPPKQKAG